MDQDDYCLYALLLQLPNNGINRISLIQERQATDAGWRNNCRSIFQGYANESHRNSIYVLYFVGRKERAVSTTIDHVCREVIEARSHKAIFILAAIDLVAAAVLHALQLQYTFVEFMVAHCGIVQADLA